MLHGKSSIQETYYDILSAKEDATCEEIRSCYRTSILNTHPDKLQNAAESSPLESGLRDRFFKVQKAWEILGNPRSRALYDSELRASRQDDVVAADDVSLEDMMVEDGEEMIELFYQCRCGDYFSVDSLELGENGVFFVEGWQQYIFANGGWSASISYSSLWILFFKGPTNDQFGYLCF